jgi:hypothetical protein
MTYSAENRRRAKSRTGVALFQKTVPGTPCKKRCLAPFLRLTPPLTPLFGKTAGVAQKSHFFQKVAFLDEFCFF